MADWQPIETAPVNDGVLVADFRGVVSAAFKDRWGDWTVLGDDYSAPAEYLAHWAPFPDGPKAPTR
jgi:hypothetical protein